ncbi:MAG: TolB family protein, partial [Gaiellaceae bacterium]
MELLAGGDSAGLGEALELARGIRTLAPVDAKARERLLEALERNSATLPAATIVGPAEKPAEPVGAGGQFVTHAALSSAPVLASAHAAMMRGETGRTLRSLEKARRILLDRADLGGLGELLEIAQRLPTAKARHEKARRELIDAAQQNVRFLDRRKALEAGSEWRDPFAATAPKTTRKLPSLPPMSRREIAVASVIVLAVVAVLTAWALANRAPQRAAHAIKCPTGQEGSPTWSPDGKEIAFAKNGSCGTQITVISVEGGRMRTVTDRYGIRPDWSPDGDQILYHSRKGFSVV